MICQHCKDAADLQNSELHELCKNNDSVDDDHTWCDCHHRIGPSAKYIQPGALTNMPRVIE